MPAVFAKGVNGAQGTGTWYLWYCENLEIGLGTEAQEVPDANDWVLIEEGIATFGYKAKLAGEGGAQVLLKSNIDGSLATGLLLV